MKIVIATPILFDSTSPFNHLMYDILNGFIEAGHDVTRIVATESLDDESYKMGIEGIKYVPVIRKKQDHANIIKRFITDTFTNIKMSRMLRKYKADVLFEDVSYSSWCIVKKAKKLGMRTVSMFQDVWPDNAVQSGLISEGSLVYRFFEFFQRPVYNSSDKLICISDDIKDFIVSKGVKDDRIDVIYNWGYDDSPVSISWEENKFVEKYSIPQDKFYAVYAGNIGRMQNIQLIVKTAKLLEQNKDIHFLIIGDGVMRDEIEIMSKNMKNVTMLSFQPQELATSIYSMASVNIIPLVPGGLKSALPSKIGVCLSCGRPIIACVDKGSKLEENFKKFGSGSIVSPRDPSELASEILKYYGHESQLRYDFFENNFRRSENIKRYASVIGR